MDATDLGQCWNSCALLFSVFKPIQCSWHETLDKKVISREAILSVISNLANKYGAVEKHKC